MKKFTKYKTKIKAKERKEAKREKNWINSIISKTLDKTCPKCDKDLREAYFAFSGSNGYYNFSNRCCQIKCECGHIIFVNKKWMGNSWKIIGHTSLIYHLKKGGNHTREIKYGILIHNYPEYFLK